MKRKGLIFSLLFILVFFSFNVSAFSGAGSGTLADPYQITSCDQLKEISLNNKANYTLMTNIDCSLLTVLASEFFYGSLEGNRFNITNQKAPLFGYLYGSISNLSLENVNITAYTKAPFITSDKYLKHHYGSFAQVSYGSLYRCSAAGSIYIQNYAYYDAALRKNTYTCIHLGGLVGSKKDGTISESYTNMSISGIGKYSFFTGLHVNVGGLVGSIYDKNMIRDSYSLGSVYGTNANAPSNVDQLAVGGLVGFSSADTTNVNDYLTNSYSLAAVTARSGTPVGGIAYATSYSINTNPLGIYWSNESTAANWGISFRNKIPSTSLANMRLQSTYSGWNFLDTWRISSDFNGGFPYLKWQNQDPIDIEFAKWEKCVTDTKIFLFPIENKTEGSGNFTYNISMPFPITNCFASFYTDNSDYSFSNTSIILNATNHTEFYGTDEPLLPGEYTAEVVCDCGPGGLSSNEVSFKVISLANAGYNWADMDGNIISSANLSDSVVLSFLVEKEEGSPKDYQILKGATPILSGSTDEGYAIWTPSESGSYKFKIGTQESPVLIVGSSQNNVVPSVEITNPLPSEGLSLMRYSVGTPIDFNQSSSDEDDLVELTWNFGDDTSYSTNYSLFEKLNINSSLGDVQHTYSLPGTYKVILTANENNRIQNSKDSVNINIYKPGINIFPVISQPEDLSTTLNKWLTFDGSDTLVLNCSLTDDWDTVTPYTDDGLLYCIQMDLGGGDTDLEGYKLFFNWSLGNGLYRTGYWNSTDFNRSVIYRARFESGQHQVGLKVAYTDGVVNEIGSTTVLFSTGTTEFQCVKDYSNAYWQNLSADWKIFWIYNFTDSVEGMCNSADYMSNGFCCPEGMYCSGDSTCEIAETGLISCSDLLDKESCTNSPAEIADGLFDFFPDQDYEGVCFSEGTFESYLGGEEGVALCSNVTYCGCTWNDTTQTCASSLFFETACEGEEPITTSCEWVESAREDHCGDPQQNIVITFDVSGDADSELCQPQTVEYPCSVSVQLPFFDNFNFILSLLVIVCIYFITRNK